MKSTQRLFLLGLLSTLPVTAAAADSIIGAGGVPVDTSQWKCASCPFEQGVSGTVDVGVGSVSRDSFKFGEYNGLNEKGAYLIGDGDARFRGKDGVYWNLNGSNLGLDSRALDAEGGQQGKYKLFLNYDELPHYISDSAQTPFLGSGGPSLTLPAGYPAPTTGAMPLATTLFPVDLETKRKKLGAGASWTPVRGWEYSVNFRHETREGTKRTAGAFFVNSAQLVEPVDYVTDQIDASVSYTAAKLQAKFAYYGSKFRNGTDSLTWQNPFTAPPAFPGAVVGQLALPPDNQFHQVSASLGYQFTDRTRAMADIAYGRMTQDENFLAPTLNTTIAAPALPAASLDGRAKTLDANLKLNSAVTDKLRLNAAYAHNERDNQTPQALRPVVTTDMFLGVPRTNLPYGFKQDKVNLSADYRATAHLRASVGFDHDSRKRTFQEAETTRENTVWGKITARALEKVDMTLKLSHGERRNSGYQIVTAITPPENPLLRKYNLANRTRNSGGLRVDIAATENINIGLGVDASEDQYSDSTIGLKSGRDLNVNGDVTLILTEQTSLHFFANREEIKSSQAGSQTFSTPDWLGENKDTFYFLGVGVKHAAIKDKLDVGADLGVSRSWSKISVVTGASDPPFPDLTTSLDSLKLYANYRLKKNMSLLGGYWYERFDSKNWMLDGVTPSTIPNVLTFGEQPPRYHVHLFRVSVRYEF